MGRPHRRRDPAPGETEKPFLLTIEDMFSISGRGTVVTGRVERGVVKVNDSAELVGHSLVPQSTTIGGVEMFQRTLEQGLAGDNVGILLRNIDKSSVQRGMVLARPGSIAAHTRFRAEIEFSASNHARPPILHDGARLQIYLHAAIVSAEISLPDPRELLPPGGRVTLTLELPHPLAMEPDLRFEIREGSLRVGTGRVIDVPTPGTPPPF
ncbi:MAG: EF-Tu/IF-2/RF-3 family GTPase [Planctomycetota bacterium]